MKSFSVLALLVAALFASAAFASPPPPEKSQITITVNKSVDVPIASQGVNDSIKTPLAEPEVTLALYGKPIGATRHERRLVWQPIRHYSDWIADVPTPPDENYYTGFANTRAREQV